MKKITFGFFMMILPYLGFAQVINEGFEGASFPPTTQGNWITMDNGFGTNVSWAETTDPTRVYAGTKAAIMERENIGAGNTSIDWLVTPRFTVPSGGELRFFTRQTLSGNNGSLYEIRVSTDPVQNNQAPYTTIQPWTEITLNTTFNVYEEKTVDLSAYIGQQIYLAFVKINTQPTSTTNGDRWLIDNVRIVEECLAPTAVNVGTTTPDSAVLEWQNNGSATSWEVVIQAPGSGVPTGPGIIVTSNPYTASGLTPGTTYEYYVRSLCTDNYSPWAGGIDFSTDLAGSICSVPITISSLPYSHASNTNLYGDEVDVFQGSGCTGGSTNYMQGTEVFYSYTASFTGNVTVSMTTTEVSSSLFVYNGCNNVGVSCIAGAADNTNSPRYLATVPVVSGQTYIFVISSSTSTVVGIPYNLVIQEKYCEPPTNLSVNTVTATSANFSWANPSGATDWEVVVQDAGLPIPSGAGTATTINTNYPATGLQPAHLYDYWVRASCGNGQFSPWVKYTFNTQICDPALKCNYTFRLTDSANDGWDGAQMEVRQNGITVATLGPAFTSGGGPVNVTVALCENYPFELYWTVAGDYPNEVGISVINNFSQTLFSKPSNTGGANPAMPLFVTGFDCDTPACLLPTALTDNTPTVQGATLNWTPNGGTMWDIYVVPANPPSPAPNASTVPTFNDVTTRPFVVTGLNSNTTYLYYIRTVCSASESNWTTSGDFTTLATCSRPTSPVVVTGTLTPTSVRVNWTQPANPNTTVATTWEVLVLPCGSPAPSDTPTPHPNGLITTTKPYDITGLNPNTCYDYYVRAVCSPTDSSSWSVKGTFTTPPTCARPTGPVVVTASLTPFSVNVNWTQPANAGGGTATTWEVLVLPCGSAAPGDMPRPHPNGLITTTKPYNITGLTPNTCYDFYVRAVCSPTDSSAWSVKGTFTTPPTCARPTSPTVGTVTPYTASVNWTQPINPNGTSANTWEVIVLPCGSPAPADMPRPNPSGVVTTVKPFVFTGLSPVTCYEFYVRAVCSSTDSSPWSVKGTFSTPDINDECINSKLVPVNQNTNCTQTVFGTIASATASVQPNSCGSNDDNDDVWFHFTATATTHYISLLEPVVSTANPPYYPNTNPGGLSYSLYRGTNCGSLVEVSCRTTNGGMETGLVIGETYKIRVYSPGTSASTKRFEICVGTKVIYCENAIPICAVNDIVLRNDVGVPALPNPISGLATGDDVGCLGSAPSPTFYYLTVQDDGDFQYFMEQSTAPDFSDPNTNGLDVDYVTWGPFPDVATACSSITVDNTRPGPEGCSFSANETETFTLNGALAGQVYVIMITNYTTTSSYPGKRGYIRIKRLAGPAPLDCCPFASFTYSSNFVCKGGANPIPSLGQGSTAGTYSCSNPALVINPTTGEVDLAATPVGTYTITSTIIGTDGCNDSIDTWSLTISDPANATISYSAPAFCKNVTTPQDVIFNGTAGGYYYAVPAGLSINATTGAITPSTSLVGTYTVRYAVVVPGCPSAPFETTVAITALPVTSFTYSTLPYCQNAGTATPTFTGGGVAGTFTASPSTGLTINSTTGVIDLATSTVGTYTVTNFIPAAAGCPDVSTQATVTITALPVATFSYDATPYCQSVGTASPSFTGGATAGVFTANPSVGLAINPATGEVDLAASTPGDYTVTNTIPAANGCLSVTYDATITVRPNPIATISSSDPDNTICSNESATLTVVPTNFALADATFAWTLNGTTPVGTSSSINPTVSGTYEVVITLNGCTNVSPIATTFTVNFKPDFTLSGTNLIKCTNETSVLSVVPVNFTLTDPVTYSWTKDGDPLSFTTSSINVTDYGLYEVTVTNQGCSTSHQIEVVMDMTAIPIGTVGECFGAKYIITASPINGSYDPAVVTYEWTNESGTVVGSNQNTFDVSQYASVNGIPQSSFPLTFTVKITTIPDGCTDTQSYVVESAVCVIPKGLSPNGDGDNDNFDLSSLGVKKLSIFNRYGNKVYGKTNYTNQWEGQSDSGEELPDGTYYYVIEQDNGETKSGWVYINR